MVVEAARRPGPEPRRWGGPDERAFTHEMCAWQGMRHAGFPPVFAEDLTSRPHVRKPLLCTVLGMLMLAKHTRAGFDQLTYLQKFASTVPAKTGCRTFQVFTSPMQRACSTTKPVCDALQAPGVVMPDLVEVGGLYHAYQDPNGYWQKGVSSTAGSAQDLWNRFQFDVSQLPQQGPWDGGRGNESTELALMRAQRVADWLMKLAVIKSASLDSNQVPDCVVLVSHADFLALLLAALNKIDAQGANDNPDFDVSVHGVPDVLTAGSGDLSVHGATERGLSMTLAGDGSSHSGSSHSSTPYRLRKGPSPGLGSEVAAPQQVVLQSDIDEAPNVYKRYRISLACTSLLQIKPEGCCIFMSRCHICHISCE